MALVAHHALSAPIRTSTTRPHAHGAVLEQPVCGTKQHGVLHAQWDTMLYHSADIMIAKFVRHLVTPLDTTVVYAINAQQAVMLSKTSVWNATLEHIVLPEHRHANRAAPKEATI